MNTQGKGQVLNRLVSEVFKIVVFCLTVFRERINLRHYFQF